MKPIVAITMGDPVGIGPEIIVNAFSTDALYAVCRPVVMGHAKWMAQVAAQFAPSLTIVPIQKIAECQFKTGRLEVLSRGDESSIPWHFGTAHPQASQAALNAIEVATDLVLEKSVDAITTAPIHKESLKKIGFSHPGHTEFLAYMARVEQFGMMMVGGGLKIILATIHHSLSEAILKIRKELVFEKICLLHEALKRDFGLPHGKIAVTSLNPHAGEGGLFGEEEIREIIPAIEMAEKRGIAVTGPYPSDTLFYQLKKGHFDAAVALYHDQALIPIKLLAFGEGVNVTVGLPFIRTSVDHGTAYDIAGQGRAKPGSLKEAVKLAAQMAVYRRGVAAPTG